MRPLPPHRGKGEQIPHQDGTSLERYSPPTSASCSATNMTRETFFSLNRTSFLCAPCPSPGQGRTDFSSISFSSLSSILVFSFPQEWCSFSCRLLFYEPPGMKMPGGLFLARTAHKTAPCRSRQGTVDHAYGSDIQKRSVMIGSSQYAAGSCPRSYPEPPGFCRPPAPPDWQTSCWALHSGRA